MISSCVMDSGSRIEAALFRLALARESAPGLF